MPSLEERALRERLARRMHLVKLRTTAKNRCFGVLTQWGVRLPLSRLGQPDGLELLERRGVPEVWRRSVAEAAAVVDWLDERISALEAELFPLARADRRVVLLETIPGLGTLLALSFAVAIGDVARFARPQKLVGYSGLVPRVNQSGERSRTGELAKSGSRLLRWAAIEAAQGGRANPAKAAVARKVLIAAWHVLGRDESFKPCRPRGGSVPASSTIVLAPLREPPRDLRSRGSSNRQRARASAERDLSLTRLTN